MGNKLKKIDLHIHTVQSISDHPFEFSIDLLESYVTNREIDCIAITNHNLFDKDQFDSIKNKLNIVVYPRIEIDLESEAVINEFKEENYPLPAEIVKCVENYMSSIT